MKETYLHFDCQGILEKMDQFKRTIARYKSVFEDSLPDILQMSRLENEKLSLEQMLKDLEGKLEEQGQTFQAQVHVLTLDFSSQPKTDQLPTSDELQGRGDTSPFERDQGRWVLRLIGQKHGICLVRQAEVRAAG